MNPSRVSSFLPLRITTTALVVAAWTLVPQTARAFGFDDVAELAKAKAAQPFAAAAPTASPALKSLTYDQLRDIRFKPEQALWRHDKLPFELMFFHLGGTHQMQPVAINEVTPSGAHRIAYDPRQYDYGRNKIDPITLADAGGHAGFRIHFPLNRIDHKDELVVFLGGSYLRAVGRGQVYGLSARALAIDTAGGKGEEFPRFTEFWVERPNANSSAITVHALLDSPRATGAYQFVLRPGADTVADVRARVFLRAPVAMLGIAPLTSMFHHGENDPDLDDFRPEVHDSDGLMVAKGDGEWLWRPLINPSKTTTVGFATRDPKGFGLMQRDRNFASYEDGEARYDKRPSAWVEPVGAWGSGRVELMQFHTPDEYSDNTVAYWVPDQVPAPGQPFDFAYKLHWQGDKQQRPPGGWTTQSRLARSADAKDEVGYMLDFSVPALEVTPVSAPLDIEAVVSTSPNAQLVQQNAYRNPATGGWRVSLRVKRTSSAQPVELRAFLKQGNNALTETWTTLIPSD